MKNSNGMNKRSNMLISIVETWAKMTKHFYLQSDDTFEYEKKKRDKKFTRNLFSLSDLVCAIAQATNANNSTRVFMSVLWLEINLQIIIVSLLYQNHCRETATTESHHSAVALNSAFTSNRNV